MIITSCRNTTKSLLPGKNSIFFRFLFMIVFFDPGLVDILCFPGVLQRAWRHVPSRMPVTLGCLECHCGKCSLMVKSHGLGSMEARYTRIHYMTFCVAVQVSIHIFCALLYRFFTRLIGRERGLSNQKTVRRTFIMSCYNAGHPNQKTDRHLCPSGTFWWRWDIRWSLVLVQFCVMLFSY